MTDSAMVTPTPPVSEEEKRQALESALGSRSFARSAQLRALLQYICEREWSGQSAEITEYRIAIDVLGRRKDFNLAEDSSVRNRAYELRQRLEKYYSSENLTGAVQIQIPRGGYVPYYTRRDVAAIQPVEPAPAPSAASPWRWAVAVAVLCLAAGAVAGYFVSRPRPPAIIKEAWGPLADPESDLVISIATNMHMIVRPHIAEHSWRMPAPPRVAEVYGPNRPLEPGTPLYMEPAQLSVPLAELTAVATLSNMRTAFGGAYQILPEAESPVAALRGRNAILLASGTNSEAARALLRNAPLTIDYNAQNRFCVLDQRKPAGQNELFVAQPVGQPIPSVLYGLLTVITWPETGGRPKRTVILSGAGSAGIQAAAEFFCSSTAMRAMKDRLHGFPGSYQVVVRCKTSGLRLISHEYAAHETW